MSCAICGVLTNHTTQQHEAAALAQTLCWECGLAPKMDDDPDARLCSACWHEHVVGRLGAD